MKRVPISMNADAARERRLLAWLVLGNLVAVVLVAGLSAVALKASHDALRQRVIDSTQNLAHSLRQSVESRLDRTDVLLRSMVVADVRARGEGATWADRVRRLQDESTLLSREFGDVGVVDAHGQMQGAPAAGVAESSYFVRARDQAPTGLIVSEPEQDASTGEWRVVLARRLEHADGSFAGIVCSHVTAAQFQRLLASVRLGAQDAVTLRSTGLQLLARHTGQGTPPSGLGTVNVSDELREALRQRPTGGTILGRAAIDQVERVAAYRQVGDYPLLVVAGMATTEGLAPWRTEMITVAGLAALLCLALAGASTVAFRAWRRESASNRTALRESQRLGALMRTASDGLHVLDRRGCLVELNDSFAEMLALPRERLLGAHVSLWDARFGPEVHEHTFRAYEVGTRLAFSSVHRCGDGRLIDVEVHGVGVRIDDQDLLYCSARDVTARRRAERALRASQAFLERTGRIANVGGWEVNLRSGEITFTDQLCHIHEVEPGYKPTYEQALAFYPPEARATIMAVMEAGRSDGTPWDLQLPFVTARGRPLWVRAIGEAEWQDKQPVRLIGALQDITEQHLRQAELEQEQHLRQRSEQHAQQLDALLRERDEMLDVLAHEVRQPLNNASAALQSAATALAAAGEQVASIRVTRAQGVMGQVLANIDNTLAVAALLARPQDIGRLDVDIDTLVAVAIGDMPAEARSRIEVDRQTRTRTASMDLGLMRLALRNLLSNALKYGRPGAPVTVRLSDSDNPLALLIDVIDTGEGVPDAVLGRLFERGARGHGADAPPGHGLGLFIVRRVMELHGGQVELARNGPGGVTMRLVLDQSPGE